MDLGSMHSIADSRPGHGQGCIWGVSRMPVKQSTCGINTIEDATRLGISLTEERHGFGDGKLCKPFVTIRNQCGPYAPNLPDIHWDDFEKGEA
ncbi:hypothetical protein PT974_01654 [Cladobotryum mycophilum]|uniref:Uncharacterized protein n=1 Tax=Cladobotryum mycophilum TaxID=491253 RepID=A0ABR0T5J4_9HYPO